MSWTRLAWVSFFLFFFNKKSWPPLDLRSLGCPLWVDLRGLSGWTIAQVRQGSICVALVVQPVLWYVVVL